MLCSKSRDIFLSQPILIEMEVRPCVRGSVDPDGCMDVLVCVCVDMFMWMHRVMHIPPQPN